MDIFINSASAISPIDSFDNSNVTWEQPEQTDGWLKCVEPVYKQYINPGKLRRMARVVRMGVATGLMALKDAQVEEPDAIIMGTGLGCVLDTEKFLQQIVQNTESLLNPTAFIQSTHNTVSGQIALLLGCHNYNFTFTQKDISFESALLEAIMLMNEGDATNVLVGSVDEMTPDTYQLIEKAGCVKAIDNINGYIPGEGAAFFTLANEQTESTLAKLKALQISYNIESFNELSSFVQAFVEQQGISIDEIDLLVSANNDTASDAKWHEAVKNILPDNIRVINSKKYSGEHDSASSFAMWVAARQFNSSVKNVLVYNTNQGNSHSVILLSKC